MTRLMSAVFAALGLLLLPLLIAQGSAAATAVNQKTFTLTPIASVASCLARFPNDAAHKPTASVTVTRGSLNDKLTIHMTNIKPGLAFDLFTIQRSPLRSDGTPDPAFVAGKFGLAWYQTDVQANGGGTADATINTILLDQIFGIDTDFNAQPINTFHVGVWFNDPNAAVACGFNANNPTPFNGEHAAGPLAMVSLPAATTLGPLCTKPVTTVNPARCDP